MGWGGNLKFVNGRKSVILGVWAAPGAPETLPKGGGRSPPPFWRVYKAPGATQTPKMADLRPLKKVKIPCQSAALVYFVAFKPVGNMIILVLLFAGCPYLKTQR